MTHIVWLKRDLRLQDHAPLLDAAKRGAVCVLYIVEPGYWGLHDTSHRHYAFIHESLSELDARLRKLGGHLTVRIGEAVQVLADIHTAFPITAIHAHEETGNSWTFARDRAVRAFAKGIDIAFNEHRQFGVFRGFDDRDSWSKHWEREMAKPALPEPEQLVFADIPTHHLPSADDLGIPLDGCVTRQIGGTKAAHNLLASFFTGRGRNYTREMSSPLTAQSACSRLSPYLTYGCLSMREIVQTTYAMQRATKDGTANPATNITRQSLSSLAARLHWHCHFIQKLESEPEIEHSTFHPAFDDARARVAPDDPLLTAWAMGQTGFPFIDACMRSLIATGWINFRMRAMLMSFASYHLWLDWRDTGLVLARYFTDYEPGIHWSQCQMQSGTTGINTLRIYNPVKQSQDQDADGIFIRKWIPELVDVPTEYIHQPWTMSEAVQTRSSCQIGRDYPEPIIDYIQAAKTARQRFTELRKADGFYAHQKDVFQRHGSRKGPRQNRMWKKKGEKPQQQMCLDL